MDMLNQFWKSITSFQSYRELVNNPLKRVIIYFIVIYLLISVLWVFGYLHSWRVTIDELLYALPDFRLVNGEMQVFEPMPIIEKDASSIIAIDTTGRTGPEVLNGYYQGILITRDSLYLKENSLRVKKHDFKTYKKVDITKNQLIGKWQGAQAEYRTTIIAVALILGIPYFLLAKALTALVFGLIALGVAAFQKVEMKLSDGVKIAIYAMSLPVILELLFGETGLIYEAPLFDLFYYGIFFIYMVFALKAIRQDRATEAVLPAQSQTSEPIPLASVESSPVTAFWTVIPTASPPVAYAGFGKRLAAYFIDYFILSIMFYILKDVLLTSGLLNTLGYLIFGVAGLVINWLYEAFMVSSSYQGTLGKMALGIIVTDLSGNRISFIRATGRFWGKMLSSLILCIGYLMIAITEKSQGLHDMMAGCLVVTKQSQPQNSI
ncbi:MAG: DUF1189 family protein [Firmicutes bacterium]|nr:DUF1189 family protein [Bacillota bacterium]